MVAGALAPGIFLFGYVLPLLVLVYGINLSGFVPAGGMIGIWAANVLLLVNFVMMFTHPRPGRDRILWVAVGAVPTGLFGTLGFSQSGQLSLIGAVVGTVIAIATGAVLSGRELVTESTDQLRSRVSTIGPRAHWGWYIAAMVSGLYVVSAYVTWLVRAVVDPRGLQILISSESGFTTQRGDMSSVTGVVIAAFIVGATVFIGSLGIGRAIRRNRAIILERERRGDPWVLGTPITPVEDSEIGSTRGRGSLWLGLGVLAWGVFNVVVSVALSSNGVDQGLKVFVILQYLVAFLVATPLLFSRLSNHGVMIGFGIVVGFIVGGAIVVLDGLANAIANPVF